MGVVAYAGVIGTDDGKIKIFKKNTPMEKINRTKQAVK